MNTHHCYYCLLSEVKPEHYPMIFEIAGEVLNESAIISLERRLKYARKSTLWDFFVLEPYKSVTTASHWNFCTEAYVKKTNAMYLFNPSLSLEEVLFLHSLET